MPFAIILIIAAAIVIYIISVYNNLQSLKTQIQASIQEIGNQLKRQASLIPNLEATVKSYLSHEKGIYDMLTKARKEVSQAADSGSAKDIDKAIDSVQSIIPKMSVLVESNPELKANETMTKFMNELTDTSDKLMYARRSVIDLSQNYNVKLVTFPSNQIAKMFGFKSEKGLDMPTTGTHTSVSAEEMKDIKVNL